MTTTRIDAPGSAHAPLTGMWKVFVTPPWPGAANMAMDHALMERARRTGEKVLRVYTWSSPTLSFGRHQAVRDRVDPAAARALGVALVRRPTGGRALLHHREVTYSVTAALGRDDSVRAWYTSINDVLLRALRSLGVNAESATAGGRTPRPRSASCFVRADEGEITVRGRKLVGSALLRQDDALLQHGSILLDDDQAILERLLPAEEAPPLPAGTLRQARDTVPTVSAVAEALFAALVDSGAREASPLEDDSRLQADAVAAELLYGSDDWTFRH